MNARALAALLLLSGSASAAVRPVTLTRAPLSLPTAAVAPIFAGAPAGLSLLPAMPAMLPASAPQVASLDEARRLTSEHADRILALRGKVEVRAVLASKDTKTITEYSGAPSRVAELSGRNRVFRHWAQSEEALTAILSQAALRAGPVSYVEFTGSSHAYIKDIYSDIHGAFFTTPQHSAAEPRVMNQATPHYVDFRIPEGVRALSLDGDDVLLLPAAPGTSLPIEIVGSSR